jgi:hypothetical protein
MCRAMTHLETGGMVKGEEKRVYRQRPFSLMSATMQLPVPNFSTRSRLFPPPGGSSAALASGSLNWYANLSTLNVQIILADTKATIEWIKSLV